MVKYKDGEKKIIVPPDLAIQQYVVGDGASSSRARRS